MGYLSGTDCAKMVASVSATVEVKSAFQGIEAEMERTRLRREDSHDNYIGHAGSRIEWQGGRQSF